MLCIYAYNVVRLCCLKILSHNSYRGSCIQLISKWTDIDVKNGGKLIIQGKIQTEKGVLLSAQKGTLYITNAYCNRNVMIVCRDSICIGSGVTIGPNTVIYDHDHDLNKRGEIITLPVVIEDNVWIGAGCIILKGVRIGRNAVIGAGSLVTHDVPHDTVYLNKRVIKQIELPK